MSCGRGVRYIQFVSITKMGREAKREYANKNTPTIK
jgi:hypothetical protein